MVATNSEEAWESRARDLRVNTEPPSASLVRWRITRALQDLLLCDMLETEPLGTDIVFLRDNPNPSWAYVNNNKNGQEKAKQEERKQASQEGLHKAQILDTLENLGIIEVNWLNGKKEAACQNVDNSKLWEDSKETPEIKRNGNQERLRRARQ